MHDYFIHAKFDSREIERNRMIAQSDYFSGRRGRWPTPTPTWPGPPAFAHLIKYPEIKLVCIPPNCSAIRFAFCKLVLTPSCILRTARAIAFPQAEELTQIVA